MNEVKRPGPVNTGCIVIGILLMAAAGAAKAVFRAQWHDEYKFAFRHATLSVPEMVFLPWLWKYHPVGFGVLAGLAAAMVGFGWAASRMIRRRGREYSCEIATGLFVLAVAFALKGLAW